MRIIDGQRLNKEIQFMYWCLYLYLYLHLYLYLYSSSVDRMQNIGCWKFPQLEEIPIFGTLPLILSDDDDDGDNGNNDDDKNGENVREAPLKTMQGVFGHCTNEGVGGS